MFLIKVYFSLAVSMTEAVVILPQHTDFRSSDVTWLNSLRLSPKNFTPWWARMALFEHLTLGP